MLLSALLRTYNEEKWLLSALLMLWNFCDEIVIADGGSTDSTKERADNFARAHGKIVWVDASSAMVSVDPHLNHAGRQLNMGLDACSGEWVYTQDVDLTPCIRFQKHIRVTLEETDHDALLFYGVHLVGDENHYASEFNTGPGVVQLFTNKEGVRFPDQPEHAHLIMNYPWENLGVMQAGQFHYGYVDREWELEKIRLRAKALKDDAAYGHLANNPPTHTPLPVPFHLCHPDCESCWMEEIAAKEMLPAAIKSGVDIQTAMQFARMNLAAARTMRNAVQASIHEAEYSQQLTAMERHRIRLNAIRDRAIELGML